METHQGLGEVIRDETIEGCDMVKFCNPFEGGAYHLIACNLWVG